MQHRAQRYQVASASSHSNCPYSAGALVSSATEQFSCQVLARQQRLYYATPSQQPAWLKQQQQDNPPFRSWLGTPLHWPDGQPFGTLCLLDYAPTHYDSPLLDLLEHQKESLQNDLLLIQQYHQIHQLASRDDQDRPDQPAGFSGYGRAAGPNWHASTAKHLACCTCSWMA